MWAPAAESYGPASSAVCSADRTRCESVPWRIANVLRVIFQGVRCDAPVSGAISRPEHRPLTLSRWGGSVGLNARPRNRNDLFSNPKKDWQG